MLTLRQLLSLVLLAALSTGLLAKPAPVKLSEPVDVVLKTNLGDMVVRLNAERAPETVKNFLSYVDNGFYRNTVFHRVIPGFMIQGGGMTADMSSKSTQQPIRNESANGLSNRRGTIAMARTNNPDSATSQFFINVANNDFLNYRSGRPGYAVFGEVTQGMEVMDRIAAVKTGRRGPHGDVPVEAVTILDVKKVIPPQDKAKQPNQ